VDGLFAPGGRLERVLPGYEPRAEQAALADAVATALSSGEHLLAEAGTGTGKSLAYLIPALESGRRVVVSIQPRIASNAAASSAPGNSWPPSNPNPCRPWRQR
jgi:hypothetical protein